MEFKKIAGPMRVDGPATGGTATEYRIQPRGGGRNAKVALYSVKVVAHSSGQAKVGLKVEHGPDGTVSLLLGTPIPNNSVANTPGLLAGDTGSSVLNEFLHPILTCISNDASPCWAVVEVYEMRKPF